METLIEQPPVEVEKLLIYSNELEISKINEDARIRANFLNEIISSGVTSSQIKEVTTSEKSIEDFLFQQHLKLNKTMAQEFAAGKRQRHLIEAYLLPEALENQQRLLHNWLRFPLSHRHADKYQFLKFSEGRFEIDAEVLEREFVMRKLKFFIQGDEVLEYRKLESIVEYLEERRCPNNQVALISFLSARFESVGQFKYKIRWTYFDKDNR